MKTHFYRTMLPTRVATRLSREGGLCGIDIDVFRARTDEERWPYVGWIVHDREKLVATAMACAIAHPDVIVERARSLEACSDPYAGEKFPLRPRWVVVVMPPEAMEATRDAARRIKVPTDNLRHALIRCLIHEALEG